MGLAFVFLYAGISIISDPQSWIGFIPSSFLDNLLSKGSLLYIHAGLDIIAGLWLLFNKWIFYGSILATLDLAGIIIFNLGAIDIIFRDIGLLFSALALVILSSKNIDKE